MTKICYLDICSGISAPTVAWKTLGWECAAYSEIEPFPRAVLAHHYPDTPLHCDFTTIGADDYGPIDLLVGGTPCQSFSVAGLRGGLADDRGNLALEYLRLADRKRPRWLVWENVPGVLSVDDGRAFGAILGGMAELGYGFAYRILDAQHFGVPQRRRRVFVVGYLGDWRRAAAVLFERHSLQGNPAPRRKTGKDVAAYAPISFGGYSEGCGTLRKDGGDYGGGTECLIPQGCGGPIAPTLNAAFGSKLGLDNQHIDSGAGMFVAHTLRAEGFDASEDGTGRGTPLVPIAFSFKDSGNDATDECSPTLRSLGAYDANGGSQMAVALNISSANPGSNQNNYAFSSAVRRLTPRECERLQGFPDDFTLVPYRNKPAADGPRYKALGNSMAVPVVRWIGERIAMVEAHTPASPPRETAA